MEKIIDNEIRSNTLRQAPLHPNQHAYRAGRSTDTALYQLTSDIQGAFECGEVVLCAFLDIEGAFDNTSHTGVCQALERRNVQAPIRGWIEAVLRTRIAESEIGDRVVQLRTRKGCPQGGVLSPLLWSLVVDELLWMLSNNDIRCQGYADDIVIIARGKFENTLCDIVQRGLKVTKGWCIKMGLNINPLKTTIIPFTKRRALPGMRPIVLDGVEIGVASEVKYLGITLDTKLLWKKHVDTTTSRATKALMVCKRLAGKSWGCSPRILRWMYTMIVQPIVTYGAVAWVSRTTLTTVRQALTKLQRRACVCITGAMRTCPTAAMEVILELTPLHITIEQVAKRTLLNIAKGGFGRDKAISSRGMEALSAKLPMARFPRDEISCIRRFEKRFRIELGTKVTWRASILENHFKTGTLHWYTDGSKTPEGIGAGVFGPRTKLSVPMGSYPSIFQAEVYAIKLCAEINLMRNYHNEQIVIFSDSQAALKAISSFEVRSSLVLECIEKLDTLAHRNGVQLVWIPGHMGIEGNEEADSLARKAAATRPVGPEPFLAIGPHTIKEELRAEERRMRDEHWQGTAGLRQAKCLLGGYNLRRFKLLVRLPKEKLRIITGFLTGHCRLKGHLHRMGIRSSDSCRFCDITAETPLHLLVECDAVSRRRVRHLGALQPQLEHIRSLPPNRLLDFLGALGLGEVL